MGMIGNQLAQGLISGANIQDGSIDTVDIKSGAVTPASLSTGAPSWDSSGNVTATGNLTLSGSGKRITGDFSNATIANRVMFQTSTANGNTVLEAIPNGTSTSAFINVSNSSSDPSNASNTGIGVNATESQLLAGKRGTGTYLPMTFYTGGSERMRVDTNGTLVVAGTSAYSDGTIGNPKLQWNAKGGNHAGAISVSDTTADIGHWYLKNPNGVIGGFGTNGTSLVTTVNGAERMRIDSSGNLLVGDTSNSSGSRFYAKGSTATSSGYTLFGRNSSSVDLFSVRDDGAGYLKAAAWTYGSDATIKENIEYLNPSNCLSLILNAKPAKFDYIDGQKSNYGYIAQDVQTWLPEAVSETPNGKLGLQDGFINAVGTGAIQALNTIIQEQQALIEAMQTRLAALEAN